MIKHKDAKDILIREFSALGFDVIFFNEQPNANGPDMWVKKNKRKPLSVEIKKVRQHKNRMWATCPVSKNRQNDDLIAVIFNSEYVLIEPMKDHLKCCSPKGTRQFTLMR